MPQVATIPDYVMFGGSFDPPHVGHSAIAERLCALGARLFVVPAFLSPFKTTSLFCARLRLRWAQIVFDNPKIVISDFEIARGAPTPSLQTLEYLQAHFHIDSAQKIGIVIGADHLARLHEWFGFESLRQKAVFVVFARPNAQSDAAILQTIDFCWVAFCCPCSSTQIRQALHVGNREILQWLDSRIADEVWQAVLKK